MTQIVKNTLALFTITAVAGLLLGAVYEGTKSARASQAEKTQQKAYQSVFETASGFEEVSVDSAEDISYTEVVVNSAVKALDKDGGILGYVVTVTAKEGYGGDIKFSVGVDMDLKVTGISYLTIAETAGLGMKAKDSDFINQYIEGGNSGEGDFIVNKDGTDGIVIDAISGATITSRAVTKGVNAACQVAQNLQEGGSDHE